MADTVVSTGSSSSSSGSRSNSSYHQLNLSGFKHLRQLVFIKLLIESYSRTVLKATVDPSCVAKKPSPYVEVLVDGKVVRKTEVVKNSHDPVWTNETFTVYVKFLPSHLLSCPIMSSFYFPPLIFRLVTTSSKCLLRLYSHSTFKRDLVLGEGRIDINKQLVREQGKFDKTNLVLDVKVWLFENNMPLN